MPEDKLEMQWPQIPERLHSEALKCFLCGCMKYYVQEEDPMRAFAHCCTYMTPALTDTDPTPFGDDPEKIGPRLDKFLDSVAVKGVVKKFIQDYGEYIRDRTKDVLERATKCPEFKNHK